VDPVVDSVGQITAYIRTEGRGEYKLMISGQVSGATLLVNNVPIFSSYYQSSQSILELRKLIMPPSYIHKITIRYHHYSSGGMNPIDLRLSWRPKNTPDAPFETISSVFYSKNSKPQTSVTA
jgi:hypothetical protein